MCQDCLPFRGWMIFHFISREHILFIHPLIDGHLGCYCVLAIVYNVAVNMGAKKIKKQVAMWSINSTSRHFWATSVLSSAVAAAVYIPSNRARGFNVSTFSPTLVGFGCMVAILMCVWWFGVAFHCCCCCLLLSCRSSLYILDINPIKHMIHKYFLPFHRLPFHSVDCVLWCREHRFILQEDFMGFGEVGVEGRR